MGKNVFCHGKCKCCLWPAESIETSKRHKVSVIPVSVKFLTVLTCFYVHWQSWQPKYYDWHHGWGFLTRSVTHQRQSLNANSNGHEIWWIICLPVNPGSLWVWGLSLLMIEVKPNILMHHLLALPLFDVWF